MRRAVGGRSGDRGLDDSRARAGDILLIALAGPAASLLGTIAAAWLLSGTQSGLVCHAVLWSATGAGAMLTIVNLVPMELLERSGNRWRTDGRVALDALRLAGGAIRPGQGDLPSTRGGPPSAPQRPPRGGYEQLGPGRARLQWVYVAALVMAGIIALLIELTAGT